MTYEAGRRPDAPLRFAEAGIAKQYGSAYLKLGWTFPYSPSQAATHTITVVLFDSPGLSRQLALHSFTASPQLGTPGGPPVLTIE